MASDRQPANQTMSAQQEAYVYLQDQIVSGALPGGSRLKPDLIAQLLGVSRMPVREALRQLDAEGYVTIRPNRGAIVKARNPSEVMELFEIRAVLEGLAVRLGAQRATPDALDELELLNARLAKMSPGQMIWVDRHDDLHDQLCATSGLDQLRAECHRYRLAVRPYLRLFIKFNHNPVLPGFEHDHIIDALRRRDPDRAERVMRAHVLANAEGISECLRPFRTRPDG